jgi:eukaryotic-like serine/threonine-protein kinase
VSRAPDGPPADPGPAGTTPSGSARSGRDEPTQASPVDSLLTPPTHRADEPTAGLPVNLESLAGGRYVLGRQLGAGGMGIVRVAHDEVLHREVAVKLLADNLAADPEARERFLREARAAARIHDPHVVTVYDVGDEAGRPYLVMELVDGPSLADVLATEGRVEPHEVVEIAAQALAGISRAHDADLLHRDVKPGNLLRHPDGTIKVTDFGVAEAADAPGLTRTGFVIGTRSYLAPERRRGRPADARTDLYALGATLHELLTGRPPAEDGDDEPFPDDIPEGLRRLVAVLLAPEPDDRPPTAEAALHVLMGSGRTTAEEAVRAIDEDASLSTGPLDTTAVARAATDAPDAAPVGAGQEPGVDVAGTTEVLPVDGGPGGDDTPAAPDRDGPVVPWRTVAIIGAALLAVVLLVQLVGGGEDADPPTEPPPAAEELDGPAIDGVERAEDPADTARNLAEWIRERSAEG